MATGRQVQLSASLGPSLIVGLLTAVITGRVMVMNGAASFQIGAVTDRNRNPHFSVSYYDKTDRAVEE